jgi:hypothetical protein
MMETGEKRTPRKRLDETRGRDTRLRNERAYERQSSEHVEAVTDRNDRPGESEAMGERRRESRETKKQWDKR